MVLPSFAECVAIVDRAAPVLFDTAIRSVVILGIAGIVALLVTTE